MHFLSFVYMRVYTCHERFKVKNRILACLLTVRLIYVHICMYRGLCVCVHTRVCPHVYRINCTGTLLINELLARFHNYIFTSFCLLPSLLEPLISLLNWIKYSVIWNYFIWCQRSFSNPLRSGFTSKPSVCSPFCDYILWNTRTSFSTITNH